MESDDKEVMLAGEDWGDYTIVFLSHIFCQLSVLLRQVAPYVTSGLHDLD